MRDFQQVIEGKTVAAASGEWLDSIDPSTGEVWARIPRSNGADVDAAVDAAARAFPGWWGLPTLQRGAHLRAVAEVIAEHTRELAEIETRDNGRIVNETLLGDLPPSSTCSGRMRSAPRDWMTRAVSVDPVNVRRPIPS